MDEQNASAVAMPVEMPMEVPAVPMVMETPAVPAVVEAPAVTEDSAPMETKELSQKRVEAIASATLGFRRYLVRTVGGFRWSEYSEKDDNPNHDDFEVGCAVFATPLDALKSVLTACDFLVDPETNEVMLEIMR